MKSNLSYRATVLFVFFFFGILSKGIAYERTLNLGFTGSYQLAQPQIFGLNTNYDFPRFGLGMKGSYNLDLSEKFSLEIILQMIRNGSSDVSMTEYSLTRLVYGLQFKHYFNDTYLKPYVYYGLLFQLQMLGSVPSSSASHDTSFGIGGTLFESSDRMWQFFAETSYHYNRLRFYNLSTSKLDYLEFGVGLRFRNLFPSK